MCFHPSERQYARVDTDERVEIISYGFRNGSFRVQRSSQLANLRGVTKVWGWCCRDKQGLLLTGTVDDVQGFRFMLCRPFEGSSDVTIIGTSRVLSDDGIAISADGTVLAFMVLHVPFDGAMVWRQGGSSIRCEWPGPYFLQDVLSSSSSLALSPSNRWLGLMAHGRTIVLFDLFQGQGGVPTVVQTCMPPFIRHPQQGVSLMWFPDETRLLVQVKGGMDEDGVQGYILDFRGPPRPANHQPHAAVFCLEPA